MAKIKVYTVHPGGKGQFAPCTEKDPRNIVDWLENADVDEKHTEEFTIVVGMMEEEEYDKMPEYMGP